MKKLAIISILAIALASLTSCAISCNAIGCTNPSHAHTY